MPQPGERRSANGETREWTGTGWRLVAPSTQGVVSPNEPDTYWGGFTRHLFEQEPAARNALLTAPAALLTGGAATAAVGAAPFVGTGLSKLSELLGTGQAEAPSGEELAGDTAESLLGMFGGPALSKLAQTVRAGKAAVSASLPAWLRALAHGSTVLNPKALAADALTSEPVLNAVEEFGQKASPSNLRSTIRSVLEGLKPGELPTPVPTEVPKSGPFVSGARQPLGRVTGGTISDADIAAFEREQARRGVQRVPYATPGPQGPAAPAGMRHAGPAPTLNETLQDALEGLRGPESPMRVTGKPGTVTMTPVEGRPAIDPNWYARQDVARREAAAPELPEAWKALTRRAEPSDLELSLQGLRDAEAPEPTIREFMGMEKTYRRLLDDPRK